QCKNRKVTPGGKDGASRESRRNSVGLERRTPLHDRNGPEPSEPDGRGNRRAGRARPPHDRTGDKEAREDTDRAPGDERIADAREVEVQRGIVRRGEDRSDVSVARGVRVLE